MSKTIDEKVVSFQFENNKFQQKAKETVTLLDKLKEKLNFKDSAKNVKEFQRSIDDVDFSEMSNGLTTVSKQFNALQTMAEAALTRITMKAVDAGEKMLKSLTIDQVAAGYSKLEQKTASVQTIMNSTGASIDEVNGYLDQLMWFADETSYSFTDMTASLGQLTASGGDVNKLLPMIMGVANATAYAGKTTAEFSRAIYNLNQSYSAGNLQLMDWKSLELAGVASKALKETIIQAGVDAGTLRKKNGAIFTSKGTKVDVGTFNSTLSEKWANKEVMEQAFGQFYEYTRQARELIDEGVAATATEAYDMMEEADKSLADNIYFKAARAAQAAKTFGEVIDATKDAVSSKWMETFELIFGNYEEAKELWSNVAEDFYSLFVPSNERRNDILHEAMDDIEEIGEDVVDGYFKELQKIAKKLSGTDAKDKSIWGDFADAVDDNFEISGYENLREYINDTFYKPGDDTTDSLDKYLTTLIKDGTIAADVLKDMFSPEQLDTMTDYGVTLSDLIDMISYGPQEGRVGGRALLHESIHSFLEALINIKNVMDGVKESIFGTFASDTIYSAIKGIHSFATSFRDLTAIGKDFSENSILSEEMLLAKGFSQAQINNFKMLYRLFSSIFGVLKLMASVLRLVVTFFAKLAAGIGKLVSRILPFFVGNLEKITRHLDSVVTGLQNWIEENEIIETSINLISDAISALYGYLSNLIKKIWELPAVQKAVQKLKEKFEELKQTVVDFLLDMQNMDWEAVFMTIAGAIAYGFMTALDYVVNTDWKSVISKAMTTASDTVTGFLDDVKQKATLSTDQMEKLKTAISWIADYGYALLAGFLAFAGIKKVLDIVNALASLPAALGSIFEELSGVIKSYAKLLRAKAFETEMNALLKVAIGVALIVGALWVLTKIDPEAMKGAIKSLFEVLVGVLLIVGALVGIGIAISKDPKLLMHVGSLAAIFLELSIALLLMSAALKSVSKIEDPKKALITLSGMLGAIVIAAALFSGLNIDKTEASVWKIIGLAIALRIYVGVLKSISKISFGFEGIVNIIQNVGLSIIVLWATMKTLNNAGVDKAKATAALVSTLAVVGALWLIVKVIQKFAKIDPYTYVVGIAGMIPVFLALKALLKIAGNVAAGAKNTGLFALGIAGAVFLLALAIQKLGKMDLGVLIKGGLAAAALAVAMGSIVALMTVISKGFDGASMKSTLAVGLLAVILSATLFILVGVIKLLGTMDPSKIAIGVAAISALLLGLTAPIYALSKVKFNESSAKSLIAIAVIIGLVLAAFVGLVIFADAEKVKSIATSLLEIFAGLTAVFIGFGVLANATKGFNMQSALGILELVGTITAIIAAIIGIAGALAKLEGTVAFIEGAGEVLTKVGAAIGGFIGGLFGGIANGALMSATKDIDAVGKRLTLFGQEIAPFLELMSKETIAQSISNAQSLFNLLSYLASDNVQSAFSNASATAANGMVTNLKNYFISYAEAILELSDKLKGADLASDKISAAATAGKEMVGIIDSLPKTGSGVAKWFSGEKNFNEFIQGIKDYVAALIGISKDLNDDTTGGLDTKGLESTVKIGKKINDLLNSLPNSGSVVTKFFTGEKSLTDFGEGIKGYATSLIDVSNLLAEKPINSGAMEGIRSVGDFMVEFVRSVPESASLKSLLSGGRQSLGDFGRDIYNFVYNLVQSALIFEANTTPGRFATSMGAVASGIAPLSEMIGNLSENMSGYDTKKGSEVIKQIKDFLKIGEKFDSIGEQGLHPTITPVLDMTKIDEQITTANKGKHYLPVMFTNSGSTNRASTAIDQGRSVTNNTTNTRTNNVTNNIHVSVNGTSGQSTTQLANQVVNKIQKQLYKEAMVWD